MDLLTYWTGTRLLEVLCGDGECRRRAGQVYVDTYLVSGLEPFQDIGNLDVFHLPRLNVV